MATRRVAAKVGIADEDENVRVVSRLQAALFREWPTPEEPMFELCAKYTVHVYTFDNGPRQVEGEPDDPAFCEINGLLVDPAGREFTFVARRYSDLLPASAAGRWQLHSVCTVL